VEQRSKATIVSEERGNHFVIYFFVLPLCAFLLGICGLWEDLKTKKTQINVNPKQMTVARTIEAKDALSVLAKTCQKRTG
jgi:hypothetical protein